jgi:hypothetical protein
MAKKSSTHQTEQKPEEVWQTFDTSRTVHALSRNNEKLISKSKIVGCFYCLKIFSADKITGYRDNKEKSAICPFCSVDSIIPGSSGIELSEEFLKAMKRHWFNA